MADQKSTEAADWDDIRLLIELARRGSLSATARTLGITHATVSRRISRLETALGLPLFSRYAGRYVLTTEGERIFALAASMEEGALAIVRAAAGINPELSGPVRLAATEAVGIYIVVPILKEIRQRHPALDIELNITTATLSLARRDADLAVRLTPPEDGTGIRGVKIGEMPYGLYATRAYLSMREARDYVFIGYPEEVAHWPEVHVLSRVAGDRRIGLRTNNLSNRIAMTRNGLGISLIPVTMAEAWPDLCRLDDGNLLLERALWLLVHRDLWSVPRISACIEIFQEAIRCTPQRSQPNDTRRATNLAETLHDDT